MLGDALDQVGQSGRRRVATCNPPATTMRSISSSIVRRARRVGRLWLYSRTWARPIQRAGLTSQAKAWYKLALARDPIDSDVQAALYHLNANSLPEPGSDPPSASVAGSRGDRSSGPSDEQL